ncbi:hypothetical protein SYNPS1DRAFT_28123 [Syncephalis pseudoplumigaleata]|uniref:RGS domain-containing protein n=1 Tax=Syncephalis pseudoplumigaleata TaxID=1712513 RepID=A0A4P9Z2Z9_9FUNG|nr:hypothetical protein SYNPS1DRAFT_28123 [Syncephalis pseudoplumigaleata]|eukprot:RKP26171.1 hypothetical protein SYNPS1DRAFT_28123 [Syncephalis pseudoplumigaleata]
MDELLSSPLSEACFPRLKGAHAGELRRMPSPPPAPLSANLAYADSGPSHDHLSCGTRRHRRASLELDSSGIVLTRGFNKTIRDSITLYDLPGPNRRSTEEKAADGGDCVPMQASQPSHDDRSPSAMPASFETSTQRMERHVAPAKAAKPALDDIFADPILHNVFETYLVDHLAEENLFFLRSVRRFRMASARPDTSIEQLRQELDYILSEYICTNAPMELNITSKCRRGVMDAAKHAGIYGRALHGILAEAEREIECLTQERADSFFRELDRAMLDRKIQRQLATTQRHVVIVGGGFAGFSCAEILDRMPRFHVTLIDPKAYMEYTSGVAPYGRSMRQLSRLQVSHRAYVRNGAVIRDWVRSIHANYVCVGDKQAIQANKSARVKCIEEEQHHVQQAKSILVIGAGPVGCETACEIAATFPGKKVMLVGAHARVLPRWAPAVSAAMAARLKELKVKVYLDERVTPVPGHAGKYRAAAGGRSFRADYAIMATGGTLNTGFLPASWLDDQQRVVTRPTLQIQQNDTIFAAGDIAGTVGRKNAFAAMCAGLCVARNICRMEKHSTPIALGSNGTILPDSIREETHLYAGGNSGLAISNGSKGVLSIQAREAKESLERAFLAHIQGTYIPALRYGRRPRMLEGEPASGGRDSPAGAQTSAVLRSHVTPRSRSVARSAGNRSEEHLPAVMQPPLRARSSSPAMLKTKVARSTGAGRPEPNSHQHLQVAPANLRVPMPVRKHSIANEGDLLQSMCREQLALATAHLPRQ